jgi:hypothetical protein
MNTGVIIGGIFFVLYVVEFLLKTDLKKQVPVNRNVLQVIGLISLIIGYSFLVAIVSGSRDFQVFKSYLSFLLFYLPGAFGTIHLLKKYYDAKGIIQLLVRVTVIQAVIILLMFTSPGIKDFLFSLLRDAGARADQNLSSGGFRFLGFAFGTTWDLSIVQSVGIMCIALLCRIDRTQVNLKNALYFLLLCVSVFLSGRTGLLGIILGVVIFLIPTRRNEIPFSRFVRFTVLLMLILVPLYFVISRFIPPQVADIVQNNVVPWAFEMFQNDSGGLLETRSSNELKTMYFIPSFWTTLFGDGYYINPGDPTMYYMNTDAGYMRHLLFYGLTGCFLQAAIYGLVFYQMLKFSYLLHPSYLVKVFLFFLLIYLFVSHLKGDLLLGADMPIKLIFVLYALFISFHSSPENREAEKITG